MAYLFGIILLLILFVVLHFFTEISTKQKVGVVLVLGVLILGAYWYNLGNEKRRLHLETVLLEFMHGKNISCSGMDINNSEFSYSSGTQTFIALKESNMYGRLISLDTCQ